MNSLKIRFIFIFIFILISIVLLFLNDSRITQNIESKNKLLFKLEKTHISLLKMRRAEKDFLSRKDIKYYNQLLILAYKSKKNFASIGLAEALKNYGHIFKVITKDIQKLGFSNTQGLRGKFLFHTKRLEKDLTEDNGTNILLKFLLMRKYEKDFFILQDIEQLKLRRNMIKNIKKDSHLKVHTDILLDNYNLAFINLKTIMLRVGLNENLGLHKEMRDAAHLIENKLNTYIKKNTPIIEKEIAYLNQMRDLIYTALLVLIFILIFIFLRPIYQAFTYFRLFFKHFKTSSERMNVEIMRFDELQNIANVVNTMLQNRQKVESSLIKSKNEAIHLQRVKEEFLANMSHELRTPLNAIIGFSSILSKKLSHEHKLIDPITSSSQHLLQIINDILDISKIHSGHFTIHKESFNVSKELTTCLSKFKFNAIDRNINFSIDSQIDNSLYLNGDWLRISQVINNFLSNAFKFTPENGDVSFTLHYDESNLSIHVKDTGIGISQEAQKRILNPFEQADSSTTKNFGGTGLGLSISNSIIEMMQGTIGLESEENKGSTFSFEIPITQVSQTEAPEIENNPDEQLHLSAHILVVEDNKTNQMLLTMLLQEVGITFDIANDGLEAVAMYEADTYDIVLMDENMPNLNGIGAMQKIHEEHANTCPIIVVTANVMKGDEQRFLDAGMDGFIPKPIDDDELYKTIQKFLKP